MDGAHALEGTGQVDDCGSAFDGSADGGGISHVAAHDAPLADLGQRLNVVRLARLAADDAQPDVVLAIVEQLLADITANEAAAAENRNELGVDHGAALAGRSAR